MNEIQKDLDNNLKLKDIPRIVESIKSKDTPIGIKWNYYSF